MIVCHIITGLNNGGAEGAMYRLCTAQWPAHYRHIVISLMDRGIYADRLEKAGIEVHCLNMPRGKITFQSLLILYRLLKKLQPAVVQTWMYHADLIGGFMSRLCGIDAIAWGIRNSNLDPGQSTQTTRIIAKICAFFSPWLCKKIVSCSIQAAEAHKNLGYQANKFVIISNGYPLDRFKPDEQSRTSLRHSLGLSDTIAVLGMVARFDAQKDHPNLLQALMLLKQQGHSFTCLLIGTGMTTDNTTLMQHIGQAAITKEVQLLGARDDIPAIMNALDIHVLSSLGEAFPNVLAEAMACGTPCVTTDVGDAALIVDNSGWVVPPRNPQSLADAIANALTAMTDNSAWQQRQTACRKRIVDNFSLEKMVNAYRQVWESMVSTKQD